MQFVINYNSACTIGIFMHLTILLGIKVGTCLEQMIVIVSTASVEQSLTWRIEKSGANYL